MSRLRKAFHLARLAIRARLVTGLVVIVPIGVTAWVVWFLFLRIDGLLQPLLVEFLGRRIPGAGVLATILLLYFVGLIVQTLGGRTLLYWAERILLKLPFLKDIYGSSKTIVETFTKPAGVGFKRVVSFEYPRRGTRAFGFVTNEMILPDGTKEIAVFLPTTPNPTSGYLLFFPEDEIEETAMSIDEAVKLIVSGGVVQSRPFAEMAPNARSLKSVESGQGPPDLDRDSPAEEISTEESSSEESSTNEKSTNEKSTNEKSTNGNSTDEKSTDGSSTNENSTDGNSTK